MLAATWSDRGRVHIWDLTRPLMAVNNSSVMAEYTRNEESPLPLFTFSGHQAEGFAIDWATTTPGRQFQIKPVIFRTKNIGGIISIASSGRTKNIGGLRVDSSGPIRAIGRSRGGKRVGDPPPPLEKITKIYGFLAILVLIL